MTDLPRIHPAWDTDNPAALGALAQNLSHRLANAPTTGPEITFPHEIYEQCRTILNDLTRPATLRVRVALCLTYDLRYKAAKNGDGVDWWYASLELRRVHESLGDAQRKLEVLAERHGIDSTPLRYAWAQMSADESDSLSALLDRLEVLEGTSSNHAPAPSERFEPARWFVKGAANWLRKAAGPKRKGKRVRKRIEDGAVVYCVADVARWNPSLIPKA